MTIGKWMSVVVFGLTAVVVAVVLLGGRVGMWMSLPDDLVSVVVIAVIGGVMCGAVFLWLVGSMLDIDVEKLNRHVNAMSDGELGGDDYKPGIYLRGLGVAIDRVLRSLYGRVETLEGQRRELEIEMRVSEAERQHVEAILHSISDAVLVTDSFDEVALANESAAEVLRFALESSQRESIDRIVDDPELVKIIKDTRASGNPNNRRHVEYRMGEGDQSHVYDVTLSCVTNHQREVAGVVTILHDVTKEKEVSEMKNEFVSNVSHELRTPLSSIKAYVEMLVDGEARDEETRTEFYDIIQSESNRLSRLIDNILNISRIESGVVTVHRDYISLPGVIKDVMDVMLPQAKAKDIELRDHRAPLYYQINADRDMIYQAGLNLVSNAIKYTPRGGIVTIDTEVDDHQRTVMVSVSDTGAGIPEESLPHIFEKFYRVSASKKMAKGTGLGLNLVKHIVETVHSGKVLVESEFGKGSRFSFVLPLVGDSV